MAFRQGWINIAQQSSPLRRGLTYDTREYVVWELNKLYPYGAVGGHGCEMEVVELLTSFGIWQCTCQDLAQPHSTSPHEAQLTYFKLPMPVFPCLILKTLTKNCWSQRWKSNDLFGCDCANKG